MKILYLKMKIQGNLVNLMKIIVLTIAFLPFTATAQFSGSGAP